MGNRCIKILCLVLAVLMIPALAGCVTQKSTETGSDDGTSPTGSQTESDLKETGNEMKDDIEAIRPTCVLVIEVNGKIFYANFEDNSSAEALKEKLNSEPITVDMHDYGSFEKVGALPWELPRNDTQITTEPGDVILYQGNQITVYYDTNIWSFTRLARIGNATKDELLAALGAGDVSVKFSLEWGE